MVWLILTDAEWWPLIAATAHPNWAEKLAAWSTFGATVILLPTAIFAGAQLWAAKRTRHGELVADLSRRWDEPLILKSQKLFSMYSEAEMIALIEKIYDKGGAEEKELDALATLQALPNLWETLAVLHADGAISISVIERMWGAPVLYAWQTWEKPVVRLRELSPPPPPYKNFEELAELLKTRQKKSKPN